MSIFQPSDGGLQQKDQKAQIKLFLEHDNESTKLKWLPQILNW